MSNKRLLDRAVTPKWMNTALRLARTGKASSDARRLLEISLRDEIESEVGRRKTARILSGAWISPSPDAISLVAWARDNAEGDLRPWHLGVLIANFSFFTNVCAQIGRGLELASEVDTSAVRGAMKSQWGAREVVNVSTRSAVRTLRAFSVLAGSPHGSTSKRGKPLHIGMELLPWLIDCLLVGREILEIDSREAFRAPELFMFDLPTAFANGYPNIERHTEGGGRVVLQRVIRREMSPPTNRQLSLMREKEG